MTSEASFSCTLVDGLNGTPAAELAVRGWLDNVEHGLSDHELNMGANLQAFIGYIGNGRDMVPAGVITWNVDAARIWVHQSYVLPEFRGRGLYSAMFAELLKHVREKLPNVRSIQSATHVNNKAMRAIAARQGRQEVAIIIKIDIAR